MFGKTFRLPFRLAGIPVQVDVSFLIILPLLAWIIGRSAGELAAQFGLEGAAELSQGWWPYALGLFAAIGLFISVVIHEFGHAVVARMYGVKVRNITLWFLGGVAQFEQMPRQRGAEAAVAIVGPIVSIGIGFICWLALVGIPGQPASTKFVFGYLALANIVLAVFNMLPALPLDGGRVLRSLLALRMSHIRATQVAASVSKFLAVLLAVVGIFFNFWLVLIALFIFMAVSAETQTTQIEDLLKGVRVRDLMNADVRTVPAEMRVAELMQRMFEARHLGFPVVDENRRLLGLVTVEDIQGQEPQTPVGSIMKVHLLKMNEDAPAVEAFRMMSQNGFGRMIATDREGRMVGIITKTDLMRLIQLRTASMEMPGMARAPEHQWQPAH